MILAQTWRIYVAPARENLCSLKVHACCGRSDSSGPATVADFTEQNGHFGFIGSPRLTHADTGSLSVVEYGQTMNRAPNKDPTRAA